ncbi:IS1 transposase [Deinococcus roseus]|uniref:Transposase n=1 Tax=Deinococcus roseus TaxID=392414 RepID=A0ABQ2DG67_9DEIO|nr:IS1 transposase [Deinococcus roseus]GGJ55180.1 hypothetical protein GCM10008938_46630 [Deinococcus roseus]
MCEGNSISATVRLCKVHHDTVERIIFVTGQHARNLHDHKAVGLKTTALQADERYGFYGNKSQQLWEATVIDPYSKFLVSLRLGVRDEPLVRCLLQDARNRLVDPQNLAFLTDGGHGYATLFPEIFGVPYRTKKQGGKGRPPKVKYRIPRMLAHVQLIKVREGRRLKTVDIRHTHGTTGRIKLELERLGYNTPNTSAVERQNGTARQHTPHMHRKGLAFAHKQITRVGLAELVRLDYNWVKTCRSLKVELPERVGRQKYLKRTPAMAMGLTDQVFTLGELLATPLHALRGA